MTRRKLHPIVTGLRAKPLRQVLTGLLALLALSATSSAAKAAPDTFTYQAPTQTGHTNRLTLQKRGGDLVLSDTLSGRILQNRPLAGLRSVMVQGANGPTNDELTLDFSSGDFTLPDGIHFDGGTGGYDTLVLRGGATRREVHAPRNAHDGTVDLDDAHVVYSNIEPIVDTTPAATLVINGFAGGDTINVVDGPVVGGVQTTEVNSPSFESVQFANKTAVTVNGLGGNDTFSLSVSTPAAGLSKLTIDGGSDSGDTINVNQFTLPSGALSLTGFNTATQTGPIGVSNLRVSAAGDVDLATITSDVDVLAGSSTTGHFYFKDTDDLTIGTVDGVSGLTAFNGVQLSAGTTLTLNQSLSVPGGSIVLVSGDAITQASGATITSFTLLLMGAGPVTLTNPGNSTSNLAGNVAGAISYVNAGNLAIAGVIVPNFSANGVSTTNSPIDISTVNGALTVGTDEPVDAHTSTVALTAGGAAGQDNALIVRGPISGTAGITLTADNMDLTGASATVNAGTGAMGGIVTLRPFETGTAIDLGGADASNTLGLTDAELDKVTGSILRVGDITDTGGLAITAAITGAGSGYNALTLLNGGAVSETGAGSLTEPSLAVQGDSVNLGNNANAIFGVAGRATGNSSPAFTLNNTGGLLIAEEDTFAGISVATGDINITTNNGSIGLAVTTAPYSITGGTAGTITVFASGASSVTSTVLTSTGAISNPGGDINVLAGQDINFGTQGTNRANDVRANGSVNLTASGNVVIDGNSTIAADDFGNATGGGVTIQANGDISISNANGNGANVAANGNSSGSGNGDISFQTGTGGTFTLSAPSATAVFSRSGAVTVQADRIIIAANSGITQNSNTATLKQRTTTRNIDIGSTTDAAANTLEISDAEIDRIFAPGLTIGDLNGTGNITVTAPITFDNTELVLATSGNFAATGTGHFAGFQLAFEDGSATGRTYTVTGTSMKQGASTAVPFLTTSFTYIIGGSGNDTFNVTPGTLSESLLNLIGGLPQPGDPGVPPGDTLNVNLAGATNPILLVDSAPDGFGGDYDSDNRSRVAFSEIETLSPTSTNLSITKTDNLVTVTPGTTVTYTIVATNNGPLGIDDVNITDIMPTTLTNVSYTSTVTGGASFPNFGGSGSGDINDTADMPTGSTITYTVTGTVDPSATGLLANTATITAPTGVTDTNGNDNTTTDTDTLTPEVDLAVTKTDLTDPLAAGANETYNLSLTNNGPSDAQTVSLTDPLPATTTFVSATQLTGPAFTTTSPTVGTNGTVTFSAASLAAGATATFQIVVKATTGSTMITNVATASTTTSDTDSSNDSASATTTVSAPTISIDNQTITEGDTGTQNVTFTASLSAPSTQTITVDFFTLDGTATANADYQERSGSRTFAPGETTKTITIPVEGDLLNEANETFFVNLSDAVNASIADDQGVGTINDNDGAPTLSIADNAVTEGNNGTTLANLTVTLSAPSGQPVTVAYATANGTAIAPGDYATTSGTLTFAPGETSKTITISVVGDTVAENDETLKINLSSPTNATILDGQAILTIFNDDSGGPPTPTTPSLSINNRSIVEGDSGSKSATFTVTLSAPTAATASIDYGTSNGTATTLDDYGVVNGTLTFLPGETTKTITVPINGDTKGEADETFFVNLSNPVGVTIATRHGVGTILNDDKFSLSLTIAPSLVRETDGTHAAQGILVRSGATTSAVTVNLTSSDPTRLILPSTVTIPAGQKSAAFDIGVTNNTTIDGTIEVKIIARATGLTTTSASLSVIDDEARLTITTSPQTFFENAGPNAATVTLTRNTPTTQALAVRLASSDSRVRVPSTVTFAPGQSSVSFAVRATDNALADGPARVKLAVQAVGYPVASTVVTVLDNEARLSLSLTPATFAENAGGNAATMTLTRNTPTLEALSVKLTSSNPNAARVPTSVTIPAGAASISFPVKAIDNAQPNAPQAVTFTATATEAGYAPGTVSATITDNDGG